MEIYKITCLTMHFLISWRWRNTDNKYGKPLVKDEKSLTMMMRRFHNWYMKTCRESGGTNTLYLRVKAEHDLIGIDLLYVPFEELF